MRSLLLGRVARGVLPLLLLFAAFLLFRGHDEPGGGFIAGLCTTCFVVLAALAFGRARVRRTLAPIVRPLPWIGLGVTSISGLFAWARGDAFLTHYHLHGALSPRVEVALSTAMLFDAGVYLVVVGASGLMLGALAGGGRP